MEAHERFPADIELLARLDPADREAFEQFMEDLDWENAKRDRPYGNGSLWQITGAECWYAFFEDGMSPSDALEEDMAASYD